MPFAVTVTPLQQSMNEADDGAAMVVHQLTGIPKCLHCGAPHACANTHFCATTPSQSSFLLCYLCGKTSSTSPQEQIAARAAVEGVTAHDLRNVSAPATRPQPNAANQIPSSADTQIFALPLRLHHHHPPSAHGEGHHHHHAPAIYEVPAVTCPVLWMVVLDGSCSHSPNYWRCMAETLQHCLSTAPSHVHFALFVASQREHQPPPPPNSSRTHNGTRMPWPPNDHSMEDSSEERVLAIYDLTSAIPHVKHYSSDEAACSEEDLLEAVLRAAVPADVPHIPTALRSLMDYPSTILVHHSQDHHNGGSSGGDSLHPYKLRCPVAWMTEVILAALSTGAMPVGQRSSHFSSSSHHHHLNALLPYVGVKLTFFLNDRPAGISATSKRWPRQLSHSDDRNHKSGIVGGWGGHIGGTHPGERYFGGDASADTDPLLGTNLLFDDLEEGHSRATGGSRTRNGTESELTPQSLLNRYQSVKHIEEYYADLGKQCADAAVGVDLLLLITVDEDTIPDFGLALFQPLADRSGAPGPLLFDLSLESDDSGSLEEEESSSSRARFRREVLSRTPWQEGRVFGAELRIRLSPGFVVDPTMVTAVPNVAGPQLAPLYYEAGLVGPASSVGESAQLWRMGTMDPYTAFTIDLAVQHRQVQDRFYVEGFGEVALKPVIQICFAYTTIVKEIDEQGAVVCYKTARQMRIASRPVPLAHSVEALYASLDPEALAVVLFHKISLASFQDGLEEASEMARQWLQLLLVCVYRSAQVQLKVQRENEEKGLIEASKSDKINRYFYPGERLLYLEGELSAEDVLLAQGHERLRPIALMVYLLLQSDPLRFHQGLCRPSLDLRSAALSQMTSMTPGTLTRCIAPRVQLWESGQGVLEPILDVIDLRSEAVQSAVLEYSTNRSKKGAPGLILSLDTPEQIVVMDARYVNIDFNGTTNNGSLSSSHSIAKHERHRARPLAVGEGLQQAIEDAANSYRTRPRIVYELDQSETSGERTFLRLVDCLIEDTPNLALGCENFTDWKSKIVHEVKK